MELIFPVWLKTQENPTMSPRRITIQSGFKINVSVPSEPMFHQPELRSLFRKGSMLAHTLSLGASTLSPWVLELWFLVPLSWDTEDKRGASSYYLSYCILLRGLIILKTDSLVGFLGEASL